MDPRYERIVTELAPHDPSAADLAMAEALVTCAVSITHECGTPEATEKAVRHTVRHFITWANWPRP